MHVEHKLIISLDIGLSGEKIYFKV